MMTSLGVTLLQIY